MSANYPPSTRPCGHCGKAMPAAQPVCPKCAWVQSGGYFDPSRRSYLRWMKLLIGVVVLIVVLSITFVVGDQIFRPRALERIYGVRP